jgi:hypothetical protein
MRRPLPVAVPVASSTKLRFPWLGAVSEPNVQTTPQLLREVHS